MKKFAFIFARGGSTGLKNKNLKVFFGKPLVERTIIQAKASNLFDQIILSSDNKEIISYGKKHKIICINRPKKLASKNSPEINSWIHAINYLKINNFLFDLMIILPCTSPLRIINDIKKSITAKNNKIDLVTTITKSKYHPLLNIFKKDKDGHIISLNKVFNKKRMKQRQSLSNNFILNNAVYVTTPQYIKNKKDYFEGKTVGVEIPFERSIDIDTQVDLEIAKLLYKKFQ